ncbi:hypothetical protein [Aureivirga sp. CE67]|uniref:hypothetical protein n=1 Tax=Aureivirga sp. CE67 TaxID=1788983 RepID=UPI0018C90086|nr:hypothetical protein [Aureivirga sp. CE67]
MKNLLFILCLFNFSAIFSQISDDQNEYLKSIKHHKLFEGDSEKAKLDTITSLNDLIYKFEKDWKFEFTGKGYYIGYTDLMFSIANYEEKAIEPLLNFYKQTKKHEAKLGVIYTLNLIGNENIAFPFDFKNEKARNALLFLFEIEKNESLLHSILDLLVKDSWDVDIEYIVKKLKTTKSKDWHLVNALFRYDIKNNPFNHQNIPDFIGKKVFHFKSPKSIKLENDSFYKYFYINYLKKIKILFPHNIQIEQTVYDNYFYNSPSYEFISIDDPNSTEYNGSSTHSYLLNDLINNDIQFRGYYLQPLDHEVQFYIENEIIYIVDFETAKNRWLDWWKNSKDKL